MKTKSLSAGVIGVFLLLISITVNAETFTANLSSAQEVPSNASTATGYARVFLNETTGMVTFTVVFSGLSSTQTGAHIHAPGVVGVNGGVIITLGTPGGTSGTITGSAAISPTQIAQLRSNQAYVNIHSMNNTGGEIRGQLSVKRVVDYDGDGKTDYSILRFPVNQITYWNRNSSGFAANQTINWGLASSDFPAPGDYDGDGKDDLCVYRAGASAGQQSFFIILRSSDNTAQFTQLGLFGDQVIARDYDGDGITDPAVFRRGTATNDPAFWFIRQSSNGIVRIVNFGLTGNGSSTYDTPVPGDYDGDGKFDIAVYRFGLTPANSYIVMRSSDNTVFFQQFGNFQTDYILPGDYDGDGKFDFGVARTGATGASPMVWWILQSSNGQVRTQTFGFTSDLPTQGDYDGDGKTDISVWRANADGAGNSSYYTYGSFTNSLIANTWGMTGDFSVNRFDSR